MLQSAVLHNLPCLQRVLPCHSRPRSVLETAVCLAACAVLQAYHALLSMRGWCRNTSKLWLKGPCPRSWHRPATGLASVMHALRTASIQAGGGISLDCIILHNDCARGRAACRSACQPGAPPRIPHHGRVQMFNLSHSPRHPVLPSCAPAISRQVMSSLCRSSSCFCWYRMWSPVFLAR